MELKSRLSRLLRVLVCGLLVLAVLVPAWAEAEITHGVVTAETVMFRPRIGTTDYIDRLTRGWSAEVLDTQEVNGVTWYKIKTNTPRFPNRTYEGFVHGNFFRLMTAQEQAAWLLNPVQPGAAAPAPTATQARFSGFWTTRGKRRAGSAALAGAISSARWQSVLAARCGLRRTSFP